MLIRRCLSVAALAALLSAVSISTAQAQVAGEDQGVTAARGPHGAVLRFSKKAAKVYRQIAGKRVTIGCGEVRKSGGGYVKVSEMTTVVRAPKRRGTLRTLAAGPADFCFVRSRGRTVGLVALAPVTEAGRTWFDELQTVGRMLFALAFADPEAETDVPPSAEKVVAVGRGLVVALDSPDATPPAGKTGYWTDGKSLAVVGVSAKGRRLFLETDGEVVRSNVVQYVYGD